MTAERKDLIRAYKESPPPPGIYAVRNLETGRTHLGASPNVRGRLNREQFQLELNSHPQGELQADWNRLGGKAFEFEVLDTLETEDDPVTDAAEELEELLGMWRERLVAEGIDLY